ncbi:efflux RND transporter periplasmic adaptor subunit [Singulisphaera sp. PoT]|uniref:efflux RND transporter periplasmic adaptor subunit n=1 Tax=Singulisphaera sp. PoT TaxID=3411797 RepID=UPI003BF48611
MSIVLLKPNQQSLKSALPWVALGLSLIVLSSTVLLHETLFHRQSLSASTSRGANPAGPAPEAKAPTPAPTPGKNVTLAEGKWKTAGIKIEPATIVMVATEVGVPGKIEANPDRQVAIRPRSAGIVREVNATLGQKVKRGDVLAVLDSPDLGTARLNLKGRQIELSTARLELDWKREVAANVDRLIPEIRKGVAAATIQQEYAERPLGSNRALLIQAYTEFEIASHEAEKTGNLRREQIVGEHPAFLAQHTREGAQAKLESVLEQVRFDSKHEQTLAEQKERLAEAAVIDAAQRLRILGVPEDIDRVLAQAGKVAAEKSTGEDVTGYRVMAPFDGTIISKTVVPSQKAEIADVLFTLADLSTVWVMANVPESDFSLLPMLKAGTFRISAAAYPGKSFEAKLLSIGASVDPTTRTVPIMAEARNPEDVLKLGMFIRITLDSPNAAESLTVPASSLVEIDGQQGVFIPTSEDGRTFAFHPVKTGREAGDRRVITSGISAGASVVSHGAFLLKSELILQNESDED